MRKSTGGISPINQRSSAVSQDGRDGSEGGKDSASTKGPDKSKEEVREPSEAMQFKAIKDSGCPTQSEIDHHNIMHLPPRSWCPVCIEARGKEDPHFTNNGERREGQANDRV